MAAMQRTKGQTGEREIAGILADLTGFTVKRRVRQHGGDSDLEGVPGWSLETKRHASASRGDIRAWWAQAVAQARPAGLLPVLFWRKDRDQWRAVWPVAVHLAIQERDYWTDYEWTAEGPPEAWAAVAREINITRGL